MFEDHVANFICPVEDGLDLFTLIDELVALYVSLIDAVHKTAEMLVDIVSNM